MNILMLSGSPHRRGSTRRLADAFADGAALAGHDVHFFDVGAQPAHPCLGCMHCRDTADGCVYDDVMREIYPRLLAADLVVLVTPLYYFGICAQLKAVIDRFFAVNGALRARQGVQAILLAACGDKDDWAMDALRAHFSAICRYLGWQERASLLAVGVYTPDDFADSDYLAEANKLGASL